jgi:hypothetical protein
VREVDPVRGCWAGLPLIAQVCLQRAGVTEVNTIPPVV